MHCHSCGRRNTTAHRFCPYCGSSLATGRTGPNTRRVGLVLLGAGLLVVVGFGSAHLASRTQGGAPRGTASLADRAALPMITDPAVLAVAERFDCPCGNCQDGLATCMCDHDNGAAEVKQFIARKLAEGHEQLHVVEMVSEAYGGLRGSS